MLDILTCVLQRLKKISRNRIRANNDQSKLVFLQKNPKIFNIWADSQLVQTVIAAVHNETAITITFADSLLASTS